MTTMIIPAPCASSKDVAGRLVTLRSFKKDAPQERAIVYSDAISLKDSRSLIKKGCVVGLIIAKGSFADHAVGLLDSKGIQVAIGVGRDQLPRSVSTVRINGVAEEIITSADEREREISQPTSQIISRQLRIKDEMISVSVDGESAEDLQMGIKNGAAAIGILRTESLFANNKEQPSLEEQRAAYLAISKAASPLRLNVRLFDLGGDKIPYWANKHRASMVSPLGYRGIRTLSIWPKLFEDQLRAITDVCGEVSMGLVIPMVTDENDILLVLDLIERLAKGSRQKLSIGAMIETPSAVLRTRQILSMVDFIRIGPCDLTQFTLAKLRSDILPSELSGSSMHPSVINLISCVAENCHAQSKVANLCLDFEPRESLLSLLLENGIRSFSVSPHNVYVTRLRLANILEAQYE